MSTKCDLQKNPELLGKDGRCFLEAFASLFWDVHWLLSHVVCLEDINSNDQARAEVDHPASGPVHGSGAASLGRRFQFLNAVRHAVLQGVNKSHF